MAYDLVGELVSAEEKNADNKTKIISAISCMTPSVSKIKITPSF